MKVYALEWCDCIHESGFSVESLHQTKQLAEAALAKFANKKGKIERWQEYRVRPIKVEMEKVK